MLEPVMFTGGLYKHDLVVELVEDLGGYDLEDYWEANCICSCDGCVLGLRDLNFGDRYAV